MNCDDRIPKRDQVVFFRGQQLTAEDLNDTFDTLQQMRWLHNRSLHPWGIAFGLSVSGQTGDAEVSIAPGFAVDWLGREIILNQAQSKTVPPKPAMRRVSRSLICLPSPIRTLMMLPSRKRVKGFAWRVGACG